ncbi:MAG TPA: PEP-CTERM sorting domain-containing protein [Lacipirellulaceae bacterium]|jgi:hypothetical protein
MKKLITLCAALALVAFVGTTKAQNLLTDGNLDAGTDGGGVIPGWNIQSFKDLSGPIGDVITLQAFVTIPPVTGPPDLGGFVKAFQGGAQHPTPPAQADYANLNLTQDVAGTVGQKYRLSGMIGAGANYSGLLAGTPTQTQLAIDFDNDNNPDNGVINFAQLDVQAAGLTSGGGPAFGAKLFSITGTAPIGTVSVRARFSALEMFNTTNPDPAAFIDDFSLTKVPEPATITLGLLAAVGMFGLARRKS